MRKELATLKALINGNATIEFVDKIPIKKTPGDITMEGGHQ
jgi:hypothetical protein